MSATPTQPGHPSVDRRQRSEYHVANVGRDGEQTGVCLVALRPL